MVTIPLFIGFLDPTDGFSINHPFWGNHHIFGEDFSGSLRMRSTLEENCASLLAPQGRIWGCLKMRCTRPGKLTVCY